MQLDATDEANAEVKTRYSVTGFPMCFMFRQGEKLYKTLDEPKQRTGPLIAGMVAAEAAAPPPPPPGAPIFMKFTMAGRSDHIGLPAQCIASSRRRWLIAPLCCA